MNYGPSTDNFSPKGVLLVNLGTPNSPEPKDVRKYLNEFLSDPLVVDLPRWFWLPLLRGIILPIRGFRSAALYRKIWDSEGSPLLSFSQKLTQKLQKELPDHTVLLAMRYGSPSLEKAFEEFSKKNIQYVKVIPLFPQFSHTTSGSIEKKVKKLIEKYPNCQVEFLKHFHLFPTYIDEVSRSLQKSFETNDSNDAHVLFSFHGLPERYIKNGDIYQLHCEQTAHAIAQKAKIIDWSVSYQSQFGPEKWVGPSTIDSTQEIAKRKRKIILISPGFFTDCLETIEELDGELKEIYDHLNGKSWTRISCLNDSDQAVKILKDIIQDSLSKN